SRQPCSFQISRGHFRLIGSSSAQPSASRRSETHSAVGLIQNKSNWHSQAYALRMARPYLYRCPLTATVVQGTLENGKPAPNGARIYKPVECLACGRLH